MLCVTELETQRFGGGENRDVTMGGGEGRKNSFWKERRKAELRARQGSATGTPTAAILLPKRHQDGSALLSPLFPLSLGGCPPGSWSTPGETLGTCERECPVLFWTGEVQGLCPPWGSASRTCVVLWVGVHPSGTLGSHREQAASEAKLQRACLGRQCAGPHSPS